MRARVPRASALRDTSVSNLERVVPVRQGGLISCHATSACGVLEGLRLLMHTSIRLPICDRGGATTSVSWSTRCSVSREWRRPCTSSPSCKCLPVAAAYAEFAQNHICCVALEAAANEMPSTPRTSSVCDLRFRWPQSAHMHAATALSC